MATEFKLPELGENIETGELVRLMISPGANIAEGQPVMELETDKAVIEVPSSVSGTVGEIRVKEGDKLRVGQVIFTVENGAKPSTAKTAVAPAQPKASAPAPAKPAPVAAPVTVPKIEASAAPAPQAAMPASCRRIAPCPWRPWTARAHCAWTTR